MARLDIHLYDDSVLRRKAKPIGKISDRHRELARDMAQTMYEARGIGLAANQIGLLERIVVVDVDWRDDADDPGRRQALTLINPEIVDESIEDEVMTEGCLSIPGIEGDVWRPYRITVRYQDLKGETQTLEADDLLARCIQHEVDHLDGVLFFDRMPEAERSKLRTALKKLAESEPEPGHTRNAEEAESAAGA